VSKPNNNFRPNPARSVRVFGDFDEPLVATVAKDILDLRASAFSPITVYINSTGGSIRSLKTLLAMLKGKDADGKRSRIITVAVGNAKSAGATLLALGDYAIAHPDAAIHFHGIRYGKLEDVTMEDASRSADDLRKSNAETAKRLVAAVIPRLVFRYEQFKDTFDEIRSAKGQAQFSDFNCFAIRLQQRVGYSGFNVLQKTIDRFNAIKTLGQYVFPKLKSTQSTDTAKYESGILREIINFEIKGAKSKGEELLLDEDGISQVVADYMILRDYHVGDSNQWIQNVSRSFGPTFLTPEEHTNLERMANASKEEVEKWLLPLVAPRIKPFVYFAHSLCRHLQEQENPLTPRDAYWLGAIDEVPGSKLPCMRQIVEAQRDETAQTPDLPNLPISPNAPPPPPGQSLPSADQRAKQP
jgi:ATP-dependent protease ClpP protease subunit